MNASDVTPDSRLQAIIAVFSTGPVGVGDALGATNASVVLPACDAAGRLLQPDKPFTAIDATFARAGQDPRGPPPNGTCKSAWMSKADGGAVWSSFTQLNAGGAAPPAAITHHVLAINVSRPWVLQRNDLWPRATASAVYVSRRWDSSRPCQNGSAAVASGCVTASTAGEDLPDLQSHSAASNGTYGIGESPFVLIAIHEVPAGGWLVWEEGKYVPVSSRRFKHVETTTLGGGGGGGGGSGGGLSVTLAGAPGEVVVLTALQPRGGLGSDAPEWTVHAIRQTVGKAGVVSFLVR